MFEGFWKRIKGWRTFITAGLFMVASFLVTIKDQLDAVGFDIKQFLPVDVPVQYVGLISAGISIVFFYLRLVTTTGPGKPCEKAEPDIGLSTETKES